jgi:hypothetical protein
MSKLTIYVALLAVAGVLFSSQQAEARLGARHAAPAVDCCPPACPTPCITYRYHGHRKACCNSLPPQQTVLSVKDPNRCGCEVLVPVCLPACCSECVQVTSRRGLLGRGIVTYRFACGFTVKMVFDRCGDIVVHYHGKF